MRRLLGTNLDTDVQATLDLWQTEVDEETDFPAQVRSAASLFSARNTSTNPTFKVVRSTLSAIHGDLLRCAYCEDSVADEVEHVAPKHIYPDKVFTWSNYVYACGPCNGKKNNRYAIFRHSDDLEQDITPPHPRRRPRDWQPIQPPPGDPLLINPRQENPLDYLWLDLSATFRIDPLEDLIDPRMQRRAVYTRDELRLNRDILVRARRRTFSTMRSSLIEYSQEKEGRNRADRLDEIRQAISGYVHRTVWIEMIRQRSLLPEIDALFTLTPEAASW